ncbi:MAG TPA: hypothetical protein VH000_04870 [Rhizomicrobium sp.]|nr:hypothetical protein [Rhizomicrobium sp.]
MRFDENGGVPRFMHDKKLLFSARELDDCLLAPLEAIGIYVERGAIDLGIAYEMFGSVVLEIWKYKPVQEYVVWLRKRDDDGWDLYDKLEIFYEKCVSYQDQKRKDTNGAFE